jgi:quercetin dioxygenase-like cupin family protein
VRQLAPLALLLVLLACSPEQQQAGEQSQTTTREQGDVRMSISRAAERQTAPGPAEYFTGSAIIRPLFEANDASSVGAALVRFEPSARTAWHTHPAGQRLVVTEGVGWTQVEGGEVQEFRAGDVVWCPPDQRHWHGATPTSPMAHIAIQQSVNGSPVNWMEHVSDEQYRAGPTTDQTER